MACVEILAGLHAARKTERLVLDLLLPAVKQYDFTGEHPSVLYVLPSGPRKRAVEEILLNRVHAFTSGTILTLKEFAKRLAENRQATVISDAVRLVLIDHVLRTFPESRRFFGDPAAHPGVASAAASLFSDLKHNLIFDSDGLIKRLSPERLKKDPVLSGLAGVFGLYNELLGTRLHGGARLIDSEDLLKSAWEEAERGTLRDVFPGVGTLVFDGFYDLTDLQFELVRAAALSVEKTVLSIEFPPDGLFSGGKVRSAYRLPAALVEKFKKRLRNGLEVTAFPEDPPPPPLAPVADRLFEYGAPAAAATPPPLPSQSLTLLKPHNRLREVELVASEIKRLIIEEDVSPDAIAVVMPSPETYYGIIARVFSSSRVHCSLPAGFDVRTLPAVCAAFHLIACAAGGFRREDVRLALSSPFVDFGGAAETGEERISGESVNETAAALGIRGGEERGAERDWLNGISERIKKLRSGGTRASAGGDEIGRLEESREAAAREKELKKLAALKKNMKIFFDGLAPLRKPLKPREFRAALETVLRKSGIREKVLDDTPPGMTTSDVRRNVLAFAEFEKAAGEMVRALAAIHGAGVEAPEYKPAEYLERLDMIVAGAEAAGGGDGRVPGVRVMSLLEARGLSFDYLFVLGVVDGELPRRPPVSPLFSKADMASCGIRTIRGDVSEDRLLFCSLLYGARRGGYLSSPRHSGDKDLIPSPFVNELEEVFGITAQKRVRSVIHPFALQERIAELMRPGAVADGDEAARFAADAARFLPDSSLNSAFHNVHVADLRENPDALSEFEGVLRAPDVVGRLRGRLNLLNRAVSPTLIDRYIRCPFAFLFSDYVLGLADPESRADEITPLTRGAVAHKVLFDFYAAGRDLRTGRLREAGVDYGEEAALLARLTREAVETLDMSGFYKARLTANLAGGLEAPNEDEPEGILKKFLDFVCAKGIKPTRGGRTALNRPVYLETEFSDGERRGKDEFSRVEPPVEIDLGGGFAARFGGKIDRIDAVSCAGGGETFEVIDYKTGAAGSAPSKAAVSRGESFQIPIYLELARALTNSDEITGFYMFLRGEGVTRRKVMSLGEARGLRPLLKKAMQAILAGSFNTSLVHNGYAYCRRCECRLACRPDPEKMKNLAARLMDADDVSVPAPVRLES
ncbi:MAG: PD-(D/E)XK nuclease family protein [bacterium]